LAPVAALVAAAAAGLAVTLARANVTDGGVNLFDCLCMLSRN